MSDTDTKQDPELNRGHLHAARVGYEAARSFLTHLGGQNVPPAWRRLSAGDQHLKAERVREAVEIGYQPDLNPPNQPAYELELAAAQLAYHQIVARPDVDETKGL